MVPLILAVESPVLTLAVHRYFQERLYRVSATFVFLGQKARTAGQVKVRCTPRDRLKLQDRAVGTALFRMFSNFQHKI